MKTSDEKIKSLIKEAGLNFTRPRKEVLKILMHEHGPFSADELFHKLEVGLCDQATIFRCLKQFYAKGLITSVSLNDGFIRYEYNDPHHHHHHIVCRQCQKLETIDECFLNELEEKLAAQGYTQIKHSLEFFGLCPKCSK